MNIYMYEFIATIIGHLAWPIALVGAILILKPNITKLLGRVKEISHKDTKATFEDDFKEVNIKNLHVNQAGAELTELAQVDGVEHINVEQLDGERVNEEQINVEIVDGEHVNEEQANENARHYLHNYGQIEKFSDEMEELASVSPAAAIQTAWREFEELTVDIGEKSGITGGVANKRVNKRAVHEKIFNISDLNDVKKLKHIRNKAVHGNKINYRVSYDEAIEYAYIIKLLMKKMVYHSRNK